MQCSKFGWHIQSVRQAGTAKQKAGLGLVWLVARCDGGGQKRVHQPENRRQACQYLEPGGLVAVGALVGIARGTHPFPPSGAWDELQHLHFGVA